MLWGVLPAPTEAALHVVLAAEQFGDPDEVAEERHVKEPGLIGRILAAVVRLMPPIRRNASVRNRPRFGTHQPQALRPMTKPRARLPVTS